MLLREPQDIAKGLLHPPAQVGRDLVRIPEKPLSILHPLQMGDDDATGVGQDVRHDDDPLLLEDAIGLGSYWTICSLDDRPGAYTMSVGRRDLRFHRRWHEHVDVQRQKPGVVNVLDAWRGEACQEPIRRLADVLLQGGDVQPIRMVQRRSKRH